ncbi:zinc finger, RING-type domain containing protein [Pseudohyphozyma bogoriensis]|nr:zinc finger, RING-type domain containing protein [Pseudohyphozyma bogoriensis]
MGNQSSSHSSHGHSHSKKSSALAPPHEPAPPITTTVDGGFLEPQSHLYASSQQEYSRPTVHKLILERRLAPFYLGLNDFEPDWDVDDLVNALEDGDKQASTNLREALAAATEAAAEAEVYQSSNPTSTRKGKEAAAALAAANLHKERLAEIIKVRDKKGGGLQWSSKPDQAKLYLGEAVECPICFLYYPPPLVHTRCCDQPICTECFVQIKRADPTTTHLESEPAACPFCMETNFGCLYLKLEQRRPEMLSLDSAVSTGSGGSSSISIPTTDTPKPRRKSFAHTEKQVVTTDQLHPDWEAKVEAIKATVARRANRRVVFRQVGDRLIPVGITSGRESDGANATMSTTALPPGFAAQVAAAMDANNSNSGGSGRRAARRRNQEMTQYLESMGVGVGQDLEELMVMEAMRLSLAEDEERQKKEREERERAAQAGGATEGTEAETSAQGALRGSPDDPHTADMLSDAISTPIGSSPPARTPILSTSSQSIPAPSFSAASSSTSSPSRSPPPSSSHTSKPSLGALAAGGLAAVTSTPRAASAFPTPGESTDGSSLARDPARSVQQRPYRRR